MVTIWIIKMLFVFLGVVSFFIAAGQYAQGQIPRLFLSISGICALVVFIMFLIEKNSKYGY
jgi:hypothetical protein